MASTAELRIDIVLKGIKNASKGFDTLNNSLSNYNKSLRRNNNTSPFNKLIADARAASSSLNILQSSSSSTRKQLSNARVNANGLRKELLELSKSSTVTSSELRKIETTLNALNRASKRTTSAFSSQTKGGKQLKTSSDQLGQSLENQNKHGFHGATNAAINFNRVISDMPYGIQGVANNLEMALFSFREVTKGTVGFTNKLKVLGSVMFTGPGAMLTAITLIPSALIMIQKAFKNTGDASEDAAESISVFTDELDKLIKKQSELTFGDSDDFANQLKRSESELNRLVSIRDALISELDQQKKDFNDAMQAQQARDFDPFFAFKMVFQEIFPSGERKALQDEIDSINELILKTESRISGLSAAANKSFPLPEIITDEITDADLEIGKLNASFIDLNEELQKFIDKQNEIAAERVTLDFTPPEMSVDVIKDLVDADALVTLEDISKSIGVINNALSVSPSKELSAELLLLKDRLLDLKDEAEAFDPADIYKDLKDVDLDFKGLQEFINSQKGEKFKSFISAEQLALAQGIQSAVQGISQSFVDGLANIDNFGDAFRNMGNVIVDSLKQIIAQLIVIKTIGVLAKIFEGGPIGTFFENIIGGRSIGSNGPAIDPFTGFNVSGTISKTQLFLDGREIDFNQRQVSRQNTRITG